MPVAPFEQLVTEIRAAFGDESVEFFLFAPRLAATAPRQIAFVPAKFKCEQPNRMNRGGDGVDTLFVEDIVVELHCRGVDFYDCCDIRYRIANAVRLVMKTDAVPFEGYYLSAGEEEADPTIWTSQSVIVQRYIWKLSIPRLDDTYLATVRQIDVVDRTQITTAVDGVLTPDATQEIKE